MISYILFFILNWREIPSLIQNPRLLVFSLNYIKCLMLKTALCGTEFFAGMFLIILALSGSNKLYFTWQDSWAEGKGKVTMSLVVDYDFKFEDRDSAYVKNGEFKITGKVPDGPRTYRAAF